MDKFHVRLTKDNTGFGLAIIAMGVDPEIERLGIYVKTVLKDKAADKAGMIIKLQVLFDDFISSKSEMIPTFILFSISLRFERESDISDDYTNLFFRNKNS